MLRQVGNAPGRAEAAACAVETQKAHFGVVVGGSERAPCLRENATGSRTSLPLAGGVQDVEEQGCHG